MYLEVAVLSMEDRARSDDEKAEQCVAGVVAVGGGLGMEGRSRSGQLELKSVDPGTCSQSGLQDKVDSDLLGSDEVNLDNLRLFRQEMSDSDRQIVD